MTNKKGYEYGKLKTAPKVTAEMVRNAIMNNVIYQGVDEVWKRQIAYGLEKYPEPLTADTWTLVETIEHAQSEVADLQNYLEMLKLKLKEMATVEKLLRDYKTENEFLRKQLAKYEGA